MLSKTSSRSSGHTSAAWAAVAALLVASTCASTPSETVISDRQFLVDAAGIEFSLAQPFKRRLSSGSVKIELLEDWIPLPPYKSIRLADGPVATLTVSLHSEDGRVFTAASLGAGGGLNARFIPEIPKDASIHSVRITSDVPVQCRKAVWYEFDAL